MPRNQLKTKSPRRWHDRCERHMWTVRRQWIPIDTNKVADDRSEHRRADTRQRAQEA